MRPVQTRTRITELLDRIRSSAGSPGEAAAVDRAHGMLERPGPRVQREVAGDRGLRGLVGWAADRTEQVGGS
jgi:hypothetical protein